MQDSDLYPCPCCGYLMFGGPPGTFEICEICGWEDDFAQLRFPALAGGANRVSLIEAQQNYRSAGNSDRRLSVRAPKDDERRDPAWRFFDHAVDGDGAAPDSGYVKTAFGMGAEPAGDQWYYWRKALKADG